MISLQNTEITKQAVTSLLNSCKFNPRETDRIENVAARSDEDYCVSRAMEALLEGNYKFAIRLISLAEVKRANAE